MVRNNYNYDKVVLFSEMLNGKKVILVDDGEEYKSLRDNLGIDEEVREDDVQ